MNARLATIVVAILGLLCGCAERPTPDQRSYLHDVRTYTQLDELYDDGELLDIGEKVCDAFAAGATVDQVLDEFAATTIDVDLSSLAGAAVGYLCPEQR